MLSADLGGLGALPAESYSCSATVCKPLYQGARDTFVAFQNRLNSANAYFKAGGAAITVDGLIGPATYALFRKIIAAPSFDPSSAAALTFINSPPYLTSNIDLVDWHLGKALVGKIGSDLVAFDPAVAALGPALTTAKPPPSASTSPSGSKALPPAGASQKPPVLPGPAAIGPLPGWALGLIGVVAAAGIGALVLKRRAPR